MGNLKYDFILDFEIQWFDNFDCGTNGVNHGLVLLLLGISHHLLVETVLYFYFAFAVILKYF